MSHPEKTSLKYGTISYEKGTAKNPHHKHFDNETTEVKPLVYNTTVKGLTIQGAAFLIAGEMAGCGILALPQALVHTGWIGIPLMIVLCFIAGYGGSRLGVTWSLLEKQYPELQSRKRNPYAIIADHALGKFGRTVVSVSIQITLFGGGVVHMLLSAQIIQELMNEIIPGVGFCIWYLIIVVLITPATWLSSPKDFSFVGIAAVGTTVTACLMFFIQILKDNTKYYYVPTALKTHNFQEFFFAFGTIMFSFGGGSTFPTIQNDMLRKNKFPTSVLIAFSGILILYLPMAISGYAVYGYSVDANVAVSISDTPLRYFGNLLMAVHLILAFLIIINPVCQHMEEAFNISHEFNWHRCLLRSLIMIGVLFIGQTIPKFNILLSLIGGTTIALLTYILPSYCYIRICEQAPSDVFPRPLPLYKKIILWEIILIGCIGGLASTYSAILYIINDSKLTVPCYLRS